MYPLPVSPCHEYELAKKIRSAAPQHSDAVSEGCLIKDLHIQPVHSGLCSCPLVFLLTGAGTEIAPLTNPGVGGASIGRAW